MRTGIDLMPLRQGCERSVISTQSRRRLMKNPLVVLLLSLGTATPCLSASDRFLADKPSPLKLARPGNDRSGLVHFTGNARPKYLVPVALAVLTAVSRAVKAPPTLLKVAPGTR